MDLPAPPRLDAARHSLLLDFDGTFVDFAPRPDAVQLRPDSLGLLEALQAYLHGALAIVTGRRISDVDVFLSPLRLPAVGVHGQESRLGIGEIRMRSVTPDLEVARTRIAAELAAGEPFLLEDKQSAIVLHFRLHPHLHDRAAEIAMRAVAGLPGIQALSGHDIVEVRQVGVSKADAVAILAESPLFAGRVPVFVGDDATDEDGFRSVMAARGFAVKVGPGETAANYRLEGLEAVHAWLRACLPERDQRAGTAAGR